MNRYDFTVVVDRQVHYTTAFLPHTVPVIKAAHAYGETREEAKAKLEAKGYTIIEPEENTDEQV